MPTVGAYEAKTQFSEIIRKVQQGERITITRYGEPVAVLCPVESAPPRPLQEIIEDIKAFRQGRQLGELSLRGMIEEGRT